MADLVIPNTFSPSTPAKSADVNANFDAIEAYINNLTDASLAQGPRVLDHDENNTDSASFATAVVDVGLVLAFTMPTLRTNQWLKLSLGITSVELINSGGWPQAGGRVEFRVRESSTSTTRMYLQMLIGSGGGYDPNASPSGYAERKFSADESPWAAGTTVRLHVYGSLGGLANDGKARVNADDGSVRPFFCAEVV